MTKQSTSISSMMPVRTKVDHPQKVEMATTPGRDQETTKATGRDQETAKAATNGRNQETTKANGDPLNTDGNPKMDPLNTNGGKTVTANGDPLNMNGETVTTKTDPLNTNGTKPKHTGEELSNISNLDSIEVLLNQFPN